MQGLKIAVNVVVTSMNNYYRSFKKLVEVLTVLRMALL